MMFNKPCYLVTKAALRDEGFFHFIEPAPITPSRVLKIEHKTKIEASGDFDTKVQAISAPMLSAIAEDTNAVMALLPAGQQFLFFGSKTVQCDAQREAYKAVGLNVESYHNKISSWEQKKIIERFRAGEIQGLCTVTKVNRGFDVPNISLVVIGFGTASRSKYEQMCGRAQRVLAGKTVAWVLDYGGHGLRFGSANWDWPEAIEFDRREKLRVPAEEVAKDIRTGRHDPKCEVRPDNFLDLFEATLDLFEVVVRPTPYGDSADVFFVHAVGYSKVRYRLNKWTALALRSFTGFRGFMPVPQDVDHLTEIINDADRPSHIMLRRVFDTYWNKIAIAVVGFVHNGVEHVFDNKPVISQDWLRQRAQDRMAGYDHEARP
jgi:hypothetical protein